MRHVIALRAWFRRRALSRQAGPAQFRALLCPDAVFGPASPLAWRGFARHASGQPIPRAATTGVPVWDDDLTKVLVPYRAKGRGPKNKTRRLDKMRWWYPSTSRIR